MKILKSSLLLLFVFCLAICNQSCGDATIDPCEGVSCENGGVCNEVGSCDCLDGFSGPNCEIQDLCFNVICENGGTCIEGICDCPDGYAGVNCESLDPSMVQDFLDAGMTPLELYNANVPLDSIYCKMYEGGLIFYLNTNDGTGMVAATENQSEGAVWGCPFTELAGADGTTVGTGAQNTLDILASCSDNGTAARLCDDLVLNGKSDWFLPSKEELALMQTNLFLNCHSSMTVAWYVTSSEVSWEQVWMRYIGIPTSSSTTWKDINLYVRAARSF